MEAGGWSARHYLEEIVTERASHTTDESVRTTCSFARAERPDTLSGLLHVSRYSDALGFDMIGWTTSNSGERQALCWEVKSSTGEGFHLPGPPLRRRVGPSRAVVRRESGRQIRCAPRAPGERHRSAQSRGSSRGPVVTARDRAPSL